MPVITMPMLKANVAKAAANCSPSASAFSMPVLYDSYAAKICQFAELVPQAYDTHHLNEIVMALPLAEAHAVLDGVELDALPCLGEGVALNSHVQAHFFNVIGTQSRELWEITKPFLIARKYLERLEG